MRPKEGSNPNSALIVSQLINPSHKGWDCHKLKNLFDEQTIKATQRIPISFHSQLDKWIWTATSNGQISNSLSFHSQLDKWIWTATSNGQISMKLAY